jgi:hypothetical protein
MPGLNTFDVGECCCGGVGCLACSPCQIPQKNLTIAVSGSNYAGLGTGSDNTTLIYGGGSSWLSPCLTNLIDPTSSDHSYKYQLLCTGGSLQLSKVFYTDASCSVFNVAITLGTLRSYTCNPFHLYWSPFASTGIEDTNIDDPGPATVCPILCSSPCNLPGTAPTASLDTYNLCLGGPATVYTGGTFTLGTYSPTGLSYPPGGLGGFSTGGPTWYYLPTVPHVAGQTAMGAVMSCSGTPGVLSTWAVLMTATLSGGSWVWAYNGAVGGNITNPGFTYACSPLHIHLAQPVAPGDPTCTATITWNGFWDA